jgi:aspartate carbamoyltransferase regulatory subunit
MQFFVHIVAVLIHHTAVLPIVTIMGVAFSIRSLFGLCICVLAANSSLRLDSDINIFASESEVVALSEPCIAVVKEIMSVEDTAELQCSTPSDMVYTIPHVDTAWIRQKETSGELISGETLLDIPPNTFINKKTQTLSLDAPPTLVNDIEDTGIRKRRHLAVTTGVKTVLVVRVSATDSTTSSSEAQLASDIFGDNGDQINLKSQYNDCSFGKIEMTKAADRDGASTNIRNGVVTISPSVSTSVGDQSMVNTISAKLAEEFSTAASNLADHVMYCLPPGTFEGLAYAYLNGFRSVYNDSWCSSISVQVHEMGHNLNLGKWDESNCDKVILWCISLL